MTLSQSRDFLSLSSFILRASLGPSFHYSLFSQIWHPCLLDMKFYPTLGHSIVFDHLNGRKLPLVLFWTCWSPQSFRQQNCTWKWGNGFPQECILISTALKKTPVFIYFFYRHYFNIAVSQPWSWSTCSTEHVLCLTNSTHQLVGWNTQTWNGGIR